MKKPKIGTNLKLTSLSESHPVLIIEKPSIYKILTKNIKTLSEDE
jgi:hypothetical protein